MQFNNNQSESVFAQWLIKKGVAKDENQANLYMIIFIIVCFAGSIYLLF